MLDTVLGYSKKPVVMGIEITSPRKVKSPDMADVTSQDQCGANA
jgi:hypothetical protein